MASSSKKPKVNFRNNDELQQFLDDIESDFSDSNESSDDSGT